MNECVDGSADCEHECTNEEGAYRCECRQGFRLRADNRTCAAPPPAPQERQGQVAPQVGHAAAVRAPAREDEAPPACSADCAVVTRLQRRLRAQEETVSTGASAISGQILGKHKVYVTNSTWN